LLLKLHHVAHKGVALERLLVYVASCQEDDDQTKSG
jgi:hypothetical protein